MRPSIKTYSTLIAAVLAVGCLPEKRIVWSPDGITAAVATKHGLYFIDEKGDPLPQHISTDVARCVWFPNGKKLVVVDKEKANGWSDIRSGLDNHQLAQIKAEAVIAKEQIMNYGGDWDQFEMDPEHRWSNSMEIAIIFYLRDQFPDAMREKLGDKWNEIKDIHPDIWNLQTFSQKSGKWRADQSLVRSLSELYQPKISPDEKNVGYLTLPWNHDSDLPTLYLIPVDGGRVRLVDANVASDYDWSPDGTSIAYIRSNAGSKKDRDDNLHLGTLTTITVADASGHLLKKWTEQLDRVGLLFNPFMGLRWLSDGRLLFTSVELELPATTHDMPQQWSLFALDPKMAASVHRVLGRDFSEPLDVGIPLFEVSPDETRVLLPGPNGRVTLYRFSTGESLSLVSKGDADNKTRSLPCWRNNSEISFVSPKRQDDKTTTQAHVVLWKDGQTRQLSKNWPDDMREGWLTND